MCLVASKQRWRELWRNALEISKGFELQVAKISNLSLSRVQETETEVEGTDLDMEENFMEEIKKVVNIMKKNMKI